MKPGNSPNPSPMVLIADDDATVRIIMKRVLERDGFTVVEAADGRAALNCFGQMSPDIVLLDVKMPEMDGFSVCREIRQAETLKVTPVCLVTGLDDAESIDRAYESGATDFISKPIAWPVLGHRLTYLLRASGALNELRGLASALPDLIFVLDANGRPKDVSLDLNSRSRTEQRLPGCMEFETIVAGADRHEINSRIRHALESGEQQVWDHSLENNKYHVEIRFVRRDKQSVLAIARDVTKRKKAQAKIHDLAYYDQLTGLPNRQMFAREVTRIIDGRNDRQAPFAILYLDLDDFKRINDTLGHAIGDELLKMVAGRLRDCVRSVDFVLPQDGGEAMPMGIARLGGDEFVIVLENIDSADIAGTVASRVRASIGEPIFCAGHQLVVTSSVGIAMYPQDGRTSDELLTNSDAAMYKAKMSGRNTCSFYSGTMRVRSLHRLDMENELRTAISEKQFELHYQPKQDVVSGSVIGAEALLRWNHESRGWISPEEFIPVAEDTGLIQPLGEWILATACKQVATWRDCGMDPVPIAVNISSKQLYSSDLIDFIGRALTSNGIIPDLLELEITESLLMRDTDASIKTLQEIRDTGVRIAIDDFGTGYSSLSYLKRLPIDTLKIDRSFVGNLHKDPDDAAICAAILAMAHKLGLTVVAEGVELEQQLDYLRRHDCDYIQGYLFSKPLAVRDFEAFIRSRRSSRSAGARQAS